MVTVTTPPMPAVIGFPPPSVYARMSFPQRCAVIQRLDALALAYAETERERPGARPRAFIARRDNDE